VNVVVLVTVYIPYCVLVAPDVHVTLCVSINEAVKVAVPPVYVNDFGLIETDNSVLIGSDLRSSLLPYLVNVVTVYVFKELPSEPLTSYYFPLYVCLRS